MRSDSLDVSAFVVRRVQTGESDLVVSLLTREKGRIDAFARGARKSRRRFQGGFAPCILYRGRVRPPGRSSLWTLEEMEIATGHPRLLASASRMVAGQYATELVREFCPPEEPVPELFDWMETFLARLGHPETPAWRDWYVFEMGVFRLAGIVPQVDACVRCQASPVGNWRFHAGAGGVVCPACAPPGELPAWNPAWTQALHEAQAPLPDAAGLMRLLERWLAAHGLRLQARGLCHELFSRPTGW